VAVDQRGEVGQYGRGRLEEELHEAHGQFGGTGGDLGAVDADPDHVHQDAARLERAQGARSVLVADGVQYSVDVAERAEVRHRVVDQLVGAEVPQVNACWKARFVIRRRDVDDWSPARCRTVIRRWTAGRR
jgi:hypothetical protein